MAPGIKHKHALLTRGKIPSPTTAEPVYRPGWKASGIGPGHVSTEQAVTCPKCFYPNDVEASAIYLRRMACCADCGHKWSLRPVKARPAIWSATGEVTVGPVTL